MSVEACRLLVERADEDRFKAASVAPEVAQDVLWPLYAMNVEVSRAPWVTQEPMIAEMRLQWWRDALQEIVEARAVRAHEVTTALSKVIGAGEAKWLDGLVAARRWDIYSEPFEDEAHFLAYLDHTSGVLMAAGACALGADETDVAAVTAFGRGVGLSRFLIAVPELEALGRIPLVDGRRESIADLASSVLQTMPQTKALKRRLGRTASSVLREGWQARAILKQAIAEPERVANGALGMSEFSKRLRLLVS